MYYLGNRNRWVIVQSEDEEAALPPDWSRRLADSLPREEKPEPLPEPEPREEPEEERTPEEPAKPETVLMAPKRGRGRPRRIPRGSAPATERA